MFEQTPNNCCIRFIDFYCFFFSWKPLRKSTTKPRPRSQCRRRWPNWIRPRSLSRPARSSGSDSRLSERHGWPLRHLRTSGRCSRAGGLVGFNSSTTFDIDCEVDPFLTGSDSGFDQIRSFKPDQKFQIDSDWIQILAKITFQCLKRIAATTLNKLLIQCEFSALPCRMVRRWRGSHGEPRLMTLLWGSARQDHCVSVCVCAHYNQIR